MLFLLNAIINFSQILMDNKKRKASAPTTAPTTKRVRKPKEPQQLAIGIAQPQHQQQQQQPILQMAPVTAPEQIVPANQTAAVVAHQQVGLHHLPQQQQQQSVSHPLQSLMPKKANYSFSQFHRRPAATTNSSRRRRHNLIFSTNGFSTSWAAPKPAINSKWHRVVNRWANSHKYTKKN